MIAPCTLPTPAMTLADAARAPLPVLHSPQLTLRAPELADFDTYAELCAGGQSTYLDGPISEAEAWMDFTNYVAGWLLRGDGMFTVTQDDAPIGFVFLGCEPGDAAVELGFLFSERAQGQSLAFEAASAVLSYAWEAGFTALVSYIHRDNTRAARLARRLGAEEDPQGADEDTRLFHYAPDGDGSPEAYA